MGSRRVGFHVSIAGGLAKAVARAVRIGCDTFQIFCGNPRGWAVTERSAEELAAFRSAMGGAGVGPLFVHSCYLINPSAPAGSVFRRSVERLAHELRVSALLGAGAYVLHPGSCKGRPAGWRIARAAEAVRQAAARAGRAVPILLETTASPHGPGGDFEQLRDLAASLENTLDPSGVHAVGICIDSCHAFACGYDLRRPEELDRMAADIEATLGLERVGLLHANDARDECGSRRDRHQHIGEGRIGRAGLANFLNHPRLACLPVILETPWLSPEKDRQNLQAVRELLGQDR